MTLKDAFQHGVYFGGSTCADAIVNRYLLDGVLPATDVTCTRDRTSDKSVRRRTHAKGFLRTHFARPDY